MVTDKVNHRLCKIVTGKVTRIAVSSGSDTTDGVVVVARFQQPHRLALDECGCLLVLESDRKDALRVVETSLVVPLCNLWMGPGEVETPESVMCGKTQTVIVVLMQDCVKIVKNSEPHLTDVVRLVERERFPTDQCVLATWSEYFLCFLLSGYNLVAWTIKKHFQWQ